jgi:transcriptional regulator with XRE-family HTH domain
MRFSRENEPPMREISENLRVLCASRPSVSQICRELGINRSQFNRYLAGSSAPRPALMRRICDYFGVEPFELAMPAAEFQAVIRARGLDGDSGARVFRQHLDRVMALNDRRIAKLRGAFFEYSNLMSQPDTVIRALVVFDFLDNTLVYRRLERLGPHDRPCLRHYRYQGTALMTGDRLFLSDYEYGAGIELTQTVLYPEYALRWTRLNGIRLGVSADQRHIPCAVRVFYERVPQMMRITGALRQCGLFAPDSPEIPPYVRRMIDNRSADRQRFEAYAS